MPSDQIDANLLSTDPFYLADEVKITVRRHRFQNFGKYQSDIVVSGNTISGGGTRTYERITWGYRIKVENIGRESRRYFFEWEIFSDAERRVLRSREKITTDVLRPGQITYVSIDTGLDVKDELKRIILTRAQLVKEKENIYINQTKFTWDLWDKTTDLEITGAQSASEKVVKSFAGCAILLFVGVVLFAILAAVFVGFVNSHPTRLY